MPVAGPTWRVLIVDDEDRDWAQPMKERLQRAARNAGLVQIHIVVANFGEAARQWIACEHFHVVSLDMRLPERANEIVSVDTGLKLAKEFTEIGYPKYVVYSQTLSEQRAAGPGSPSEAVLQLRADAYAKPSAASSEPQTGVPTLSVRDWAQRIIDYLDPRRVRLPAEGDDTEGRLTAIGAQLKRGPALLPPPLAGALAQLGSGEFTGQPAPQPLAALVLATVRWALAQSAVLAAAAGRQTVLPRDDSLGAALLALRGLLPLLADWNWRNYCAPAALQAFAAVAEGRHERDPAAAAAALLHALDVAAYWVQHPVCAALRYSRDGWTGLPLRGSESPRRRMLLPPAQDFSSVGDSSAAWQRVWLLAGEPGRVRQPQVIDWTPMLERDPADDKRWWLRICQAPADAVTWLDIDSGQTAQR